MQALQRNITILPPPRVWISASRNHGVHSDTVPTFLLGLGLQEGSSIDEAEVILNGLLTTR